MKKTNFINFTTLAIPGSIISLYVEKYFYSDLQTHIINIMLHLNTIRFDSYLKSVLGYYQCESLFYQDVVTETVGYSYLSTITQSMQDNYADFFNITSLCNIYPPLVYSTIILFLSQILLILSRLLGFRILSSIFSTEANIIRFFLLLLMPVPCINDLELRFILRLSIILLVSLAWRKRLSLNEVIIIIVFSAFVIYYLDPTLRPLCMLYMCYYTDLYGPDLYKCTMMSNTTRAPNQAKNTMSVGFVVNKESASQASATKTPCGAQKYHVYRICSE